MDECPIICDPKPTAAAGYFQPGGTLFGWLHAIQGRRMEEIGRYDVLVNAVLWDVFRTDHLVYEEDLEKMRPGSMIVDVSCDEDGAVQSSHPTTIADPVSCTRSNGPRAGAVQLRQLQAPCLTDGLPEPQSCSASRQHVATV